VSDESLPTVQGYQLDSVRSHLLAAGAELVEADEDYEWWSVQIDTDNFIDIRLSAS